MIVTPARRIWLYPAPDGALEILILGDDDGVAAMYARIRSLVESWRGFDRVHTVGQGGAVLGLRVTLAPLATCSMIIDEALYAFRANLPEVERTMHFQAGDVGVVGTW